MFAFATVAALICVPICNICFCFL